MPEPPRPKGVRGRLREGWNLAVVSLRVVRRRKRIILLPVLGFLAFIILVASFVLGTTVALAISPSQLALTLTVLVVLGFAVNFVLYSALVLVNAAVAVFALELFDGKSPEVLGSLRRTTAGGKPLLAWAGIAATVSSLLQAGQVLLPEAHYELAVAGFLWTFFVPLVAPIVLFEGVGPVRAMRRNVAIRRGTWIEGISGLVSVYAIFILLGSLALLPPLIGFLIGNGVGLAIGLIPMVVYLVPLFFAGTTTKAVLVAVVYRYGTTGEIPPEFRGSRIRGLDPTASSEDAP